MYSVVESFQRIWYLENAEQKVDVKSKSKNGAEHGPSLVTRARTHARTHELMGILMGKLPF